MRPEKKTESAISESPLNDYILKELGKLPAPPAGHNYAFDFAREYDAEKEVWEYRVTATPVQESTCGDNRFEVIERAKRDLLTKTNIISSPDEMGVLNSFLFRCWQMGWLKQYE